MAEGGFRKSVRDTEKQTALDQEDRVVASASAVDQMIERARAELEDDPQDVDKTNKLVDALLRKADADRRSRRSSCWARPTSSPASTASASARATSACGSSPAG